MAFLFYKRTLFTIHCIRNCWMYCKLFFNIFFKFFLPKTIILFSLLFQIDFFSYCVVLAVCVVVVCVARRNRARQWRSTSSPSVPTTIANRSSTRKQQRRRLDAKRCAGNGALARAKFKIANEKTKFFTKTEKKKKNENRIHNI